MPHGWLLEAEYESGFVLTEDGADHSPYDPGRNTFHAILNDRPTLHGHGPMVRFSLIGAEMRYDIEWTTLPPDARPVYYRQMQRAFRIEDGWQPAACISHHFGWRGTVDGHATEEITEIRG